MHECSVASPPRRPLFLLAVLAASAWLLAACGSAPPRASADPKPSAGVPAPSARTGPAPPAERDGPEAQAPPNLATVPNAEPQVESVRAGGPNKPYEVAGRSYVPLTGDVAHVERGLASWYGRKFHGRRTALGEVYNMYAMTAAHPTLPLPSYVKVRNPANGKEVVLRVNDRGPFHPGRIIDLSYTAALKLDVLRGVAPVEIERITFEAIRSGRWRQTGSSDTDVASAAPVPLVVVANAKTEAAVPQGAGPRSAEARAVGVTLADAPTPTPAAPQAATNTATTVPQAALLPVATVAPPAVASPEQPPPQGSVPNNTPAAGGGYFVQIGAFKQLDGAENFHRKVVADLSWLSPLLAVFTDASSVHRLQAGPYRTRDEAQGVAQQVREALQLVPMVVQRR